MDEFFANLIIGVMQMVYSPLGVAVGVAWVVSTIRASKDNDA